MAEFIVAPAQHGILEFSLAWSGNLSHAIEIGSVQLRSLASDYNAAAPWHPSPQPAEAESNPRFSQREVGCPFSSHLAGHNGSRFGAGSLSLVGTQFSA